jgi:hypothetical protein
VIVVEAIAAIAYKSVGGIAAVCQAFHSQRQAEMRGLPVCTSLAMGQAQFQYNNKTVILFLQVYIGSISPIVRGFIIK